MKRAIGGMVAALTIATASGTGAAADTLRGVILAEDGTPAADAKVWAIRTHGDGPPGRRDGIADAAGRFAFEVGEGSWALGASLGDQGPDFPLTYLPPTKPTTIRLKRQGRLRVRLVEAEMARPIAGARLALDNGLELTADADGRLEVRGLSRDGNFDARGLAREGHHEASAWAPGRECKLVLFAMGAGPTTDLEIALPRGGRAVGRVLDAAGRPIAGATVGPYNWGGATDVAAHLVVRTDDQGRFEFDGLPVDQLRSLVADAPGYSLDHQEIDLRPTPDGTPAVVDFQFARQRGPRNRSGAGPTPAPPPPGFRDVTGLVVGVDRKPVAATVVYNDQQGRDEPEAKTDAAGRFHLMGVPDQDAILKVIPDHPDLAPEIAATVAGGDEDLLIVIPAGRTATGVVHDDRGTPLAGIAVAPWVVEGNVSLAARAAVTDARGRFAITGLPRSPTKLYFEGAGVVRTTLNDARLDAENDVTMAALGVFAGRVVDAAGRSVRNFRVLIGPPREPKMDATYYPYYFQGVGLTFVVDDGTFRVRNMLADSVARITILAPGYAAATIDPITAVPSNQLDPAVAPVFRLGSPHSLRVHAVAARVRTPIADARVVLIGAPIIPGKFEPSWWGYDWADTAHTRTDTRGIATFDPLSYDEAVVLVEAPGFARRHVRWLDGAADLEVALEPEGVIEGAILDEATGGPLGGISISLISPENGQLGITPRFGDGGRFRFGELPAGTYQVFVETAFGALHQEQVVLKPGEYASRTLRLKMPATLAPPPG